MRTMEVVPAQERGDLDLHGLRAERHQRNTEALGLQGSEETLDQSEGVALLERAVPRLDAVAFAPGAVVLSELDALIGDDRLGTHAGLADRLRQELADLFLARRSKSKVVGDNSLE